MCPQVSPSSPQDAIHRKTGVSDEAKRRFPVCFSGINPLTVLLTDRLGVPSVCPERLNHSPQLWFYIYLCHFLTDTHFSHQTVSNIHHWLLHTLSSYYVSDCFLGPGGRAIDKTKALFSWCRHSSEGSRQRTKKHVRGEGQECRVWACPWLRAGDTWAEVGVKPRGHLWGGSGHEDPRTLARSITDGLGWGQGSRVAGAGWARLPEEESSTQRGDLGFYSQSIHPHASDITSPCLSKLSIFPSQKTPKTYTPVPAHRVQPLYCPQVQAALCPQPPFTLTWMPTASFLVPALHILVLSVSCSDAGPTHLHLETPEARQTLPALTPHPQQPPNPDCIIISLPRPAPPSVFPTRARWVDGTLSTHSPMSEIYQVCTHLSLPH